MGSSRRRRFTGAGNLKPGKRLARCRYCGGKIPSGRRTFCSDICVEEYKVRSNYNYVRQKVYERDKGICCKCGVDTDSMKSVLEVKARNEASKTGDSWEVVFERICEEEGWPSFRKSWWDADHIVAIAEGGGLGGLETYQTLCFKCHQEKTVEMRHRLKGTGSKFVERESSGPDVFYTEKSQ